MPADPNRDALRAHAPTAATPARRATAVTPHDANDLTLYAKALYLGQAGDLTVIPAAAADGEAVTLAGHPAGYVPLQVRRVLATGTTADDIVALFD